MLDFNFCLSWNNCFVFVSKSKKSCRKNENQNKNIICFNAQEQFSEALKCVMDEKRKSDIFNFVGFLLTDKKIYQSKAVLQNEIHGRKRI